MQFRHAVGLGSLEAHHGDHVAVQLARLEGRLQLLLRVEHPGRRFDHMAVGRNGGGLDHGGAEIAVEHIEAAGRLEGLARRAQHAFVAGGRRGIGIDEFAVRAEPCFLGIAGEARAHDGLHILVQQPGAQQLADQEAHAAGRVEVVHVGLAVRIDAASAAARRAESSAKSFQVSGDAGRRGHGDQMHRVVGRAAGGEQADDAVDHRLLVIDAADRR